jgi:hypothetical protein
MVLQTLSLLFDVLVVARMLQLRLFCVYPLFFIFLCIPVAPQTALIIWGANSKEFFRVWSVVEPIRNVVYILVVWELFSIIFRRYAGLRSLARWMMGIAACIALVGFVFSLRMRGSRLFATYTLGVVRFERGVAFGLVIFIVILLYLISRYPITLARNHIVLCLLYSGWFLGDSAILGISSFLPKDFVSVVNDCLAVLEIASYAGWALLLSAAGEYQEARIRHHLSSSTEAVLVGKLNALNDALLRAGRSISPLGSRI